MAVLRKGILGKALGQCKRHLQNPVVRASGKRVLAMLGLLTCDFRYMQSVYHEGTPRCKSFQKK